MKRERRARASPRCTQHEIASAVITTQRVWQSVHSTTAGVRGEQGAKPSRIQHERYIRGEQGGSPRCTQRELASAVITTQRVWQSVHSTTAGVRGEQGESQAALSTKDNIDSYYATACVTAGQWNHPCRRLGCFSGSSRIASTCQRLGRVS